MLAAQTHRRHRFKRGKFEYFHAADVSGHKSRIYHEEENAKNSRAANLFPGMDDLFVTKTRQDGFEYHLQHRSNEQSSVEAVAGECLRFKRQEVFEIRGAATVGYWATIQRRQLTL